jgi:2-dehydropantoate 2-reductase
MKVAILGAGAVGLCVAARLSTVCEVYAVARHRHAKAIREHGFEMTGMWGDGVFTFPCEETFPDDEVDYVIITAKSRDTEEICRQFRDRIAGKEVISLQNGIGNEEIIASHTDRVIGGMIITGFEWRGDAHVHVSVEAGPIKLGRFPEGFDDSVAAILGCFKAAGLNAEQSDSIRSDLWGKTLYNCALNPLGAIMGVPYGKLSDPAAWHIIEQVVREAFAVCTADGVRLIWGSAEEYLRYLKDVQLPATALHHSSMLQDLAKGRRTEIDFLNGAVVAMGARYGIPTPINDTLTSMIRFRESLPQNTTGAGDT